MERQEGAMACCPPETAGGGLVPEAGLTRRTLLGAGLAATASGGVGVCTVGGLPAAASAQGKAASAAARATPGAHVARAAPGAEEAVAAPGAVEVHAAPSEGAAVTAAAGEGRPAFVPTLAQDWPAGRDPAGWLVSEKLDGVRALWDGERMRFRSGRALALPAVIRQRLPSEPLDGELWLGRGRFEDLSGLLRSDRVADEAAWRAVQYHVFELPADAGRFAERAARLQRIASASAWPGLVAAPQQPVADAAALQRRLDAVVAAGGEGLMLHQADAPVANGRSPWLCKFKPLNDAEAVVIGHRAGRGKHEGRLGALQVRADDGQVFYLGTGFTDAQRAAPPAIGTRVTFSHHGRTELGVPRFARFMRQALAF
jgi:DNA ligase-1